MIHELERVVLTDDLPDYHLQVGDVGTVVLVHGDGAGYEVEFVALSGETVAVVSVSADQVRRVRKGEIAHVRAVEA
jgi:hypothetical protein